MRNIRFVSELILAAVALFLLGLGLLYQVSLGFGLILGAFLWPIFILELFFSGRSQKRKPDAKKLIEEYITRNIGFDFHRKELLDANNLTDRDISYIEEWYASHLAEQQLRQTFWKKDFLDRVTPIGISWASGYTPHLDKFSMEAKQEFSGTDEHFFFSGYTKQIEAAEQILAQSGRNNVAVVGDEGVGKQFLLAGLERLIETGRALPSLSFKRVVWLDTEAVLSGIENPGQLRERLEAVFADVQSAGNIILVMERIQGFLDPAFPEIPDILVSFLQSERSQVVATITPRMLASRMNRADMKGQFAQVKVEEPGIKHTMFALQEVALVAGSRDHIAIPYQSLKKLVELADQFSIEMPRPQKDINLLQEAVSFVKSKNKKILDVPDLLELVSQRTGVPLGTIKQDEKKKLLNLDTLLHKQLIGQNEAVTAISKALKRARMAVRSTKRPIGSFLFLGPTGVGKTTAAKALANIYFGKGDMIRFDMSEFQKVDDTNRLVDTLGREIRQTPFSLLLLDEIEKGHPDILNLFLQILDEGVFTDTQGFRVDCRNLIIIATSNAGAEFIRTSIERVGTEKFNRELLDKLQQTGKFRPEFLNRFDAVVTFKPLGKDELFAIADILLRDLAKRLKSEHKFTFVATQELKSFLVEKGYDPQYGARPMRRVMQDSIETTVADKLLKKQIKAGDNVELKVEELSS